MAGWERMESAGAGLGAHSPGALWNLDECLDKQATYKYNAGLSAPTFPKRPVKKITAGILYF